MHVIVNGEPHSLAEGLTVAGLITELGLNQRRIAVEVNRAIIARDHYLAHILTDGDQIEIVNFVGGG